MVSLILTNSFEHDYNETNISLTLDRARQYATATGFIPDIQFYDNNEVLIKCLSYIPSQRGECEHQNKRHLVVKFKHFDWST